MPQHQSKQAKPESGAAKASKVSRCLGLVSKKEKLQNLCKGGRCKGSAFTALDPLSDALTRYESLQNLKGTPL